MTAAPRYTVVVVAYRSRDPLTGFLESIGQNVPVLIVNNSMDEDDLADLVQQHANVSQVDAGGNIGFSAAANLGARSTDSEFLIFMNPDTLPRESELSEMIEVLDESNSIASCGAGGIATAGGGALPTIPRVFAHVFGLHRVFATVGMYFYPKNGERLDVGWISGSCLAIRRSDHEAVGGFDEDYFVFMSDFDLGRKLTLLGRRQVLLSDVIVEHFDGGSSDLPSEWTWEQRGKGWGQYINRTMKGLRRRIIAMTLAGGFEGRRLAYVALRKRLKAAEMRTMRDAMTTELHSAR